MKISSFNLKLLIIFCLNSGDIYIFLIISSSFVSGLIFGEVFDALVFVSTILIPIKSLVVSAVFWMTLFEEVLKASVVDCLAWWRRSWLYLLYKLLLIFLPV